MIIIKWILKRLKQFNRKQVGEVSMTIPMLIGIMIAIVIGINLIAPVVDKTKEITDATTTTTTTAIVQNTTTTGIETTSAYSEPVKSIANLLPIIFIAIILLTTVKIIGGGGFFGFGHGEKEGKSVEVKIRTNSGKLISIIMKASESLEPYINNLDKLLGIKTVINNKLMLGLRLDELTNDLGINEEDFDWYITAKQPNENVFKVIGLNKIDEANNVVYILGKRNMELDKEPKAFLIKVPMSRTNDEIASPKELFAGYYTT